MSLTDCLITVAFAVIAYVIQRVRLPQTISPDGVWYLSAATGGGTLPLPFALRQTLPELLGSSPRVWSIATGLSWIAIAPALFALSGSITAVAIWLFLPFGAQVIRHPVLVDAPALLLAVLAALAWRYDHVFVAFSLAIASSLCKEPGALFAAAFAGTPWLAVVVPIAMFSGVGNTGRTHVHALPVRHNWFDMSRMILPWGAGALALLGSWTVSEIIAAALGYAQLLVANDEARLYQWAAPAVLPIAAEVIDGWSLWLRILAVMVSAVLCLSAKESRA